MNAVGDPCDARVGTTCVRVNNRPDARDCSRHEHLDVLGLQLTLPTAPTAEPEAYPRERQATDGTPKVNVTTTETLPN